MTIISRTLLNNKSDCALIPFITAGYPNLNSTIEALYTLDNEGADIIELGIPYSDALADGPVIQESSRIALQQGVYLDQILAMLKKITPKLNAPIVIFTYYNPILVRGINDFVKDISDAGAKGLIIPDLPLEEADYVINLCSQFSIELILFIAPTSSELRIELILSKSPGCIYLVSSTGVTGLRNRLDDQIDSLAKKIKLKTNKLIILGFGISNVEQVAKVSKWNIDGIVIGSAFIKAMNNKSDGEAIRSLGSFCQLLRVAIDK
uniref:Tryptophan synthase alpha chain n=1 Tax=Leiomenia cribrosa TaxID=217483 RepID=A0A4D6WVE0_9FLOR|nr:Tryptophan synthase alpha subunit [Leiomenia cribrosa]